MNGDEGFNPLTSQHLQIINQGCEECARARQYLDKLKQAGHPVDQHIETTDAANAYLRTVKKIFFPSAT